MFIILIFLCSLPPPVRPHWQKKLSVFAFHPFDEDRRDLVPPLRRYVSLRRDGAVHLQRPAGGITWHYYAEVADSTPLVRLFGCSSRHEHGAYASAPVSRDIRVFQTCRCYGDCPPLAWKCGGGLCWIDGCCSGWSCGVTVAFYSLRG